MNTMYTNINPFLGQILRTQRQFVMEISSLADLYF